MIYVLIIGILSCAGMIAVTLIKPQIKVGCVQLSTYWMVTLIGALALAVFGLIGFDEIIAGLTADAAINPLKILVLFISMTILSVFLDEMGFFRYLANQILKKAGSSQLRMFTTFYVAISLLTIFTSNDIIILTFTPFICYFTKRAKINPVPYLVSQFIAANTTSILLIIGNPTNIYLASSSGIGFFEYLKIMAIPTVFAAVAAYFVMLLIFRGQLREKIVHEPEEVGIKQKPLLIAGLVFLCGTTVLLAVSSYVGLQMWIIAACAAVGLIAAVLLICLIKREKPAALLATLRRAPYELIPFVISMFVIVLSLEKYEVTAKIARTLGESNVIFVYGPVSVLFANLINNIPMSVLFSSVIQNLGATVQIKAVYAVIIGSNIGAFLTPIGALAGIMWLQILKTHEVKFSFLKFFKYGVIICIPVLAAALLGLTLAFMF